MDEPTRTPFAIPPEPATGAVRAFPAWRSRAAAQQAEAEAETRLQARRAVARAEVVLQAAERAAWRREVRQRRARQSAALLILAGVLLATLALVAACLARSQVSL